MKIVRRSAVTLFTMLALFVIGQNPAFAATSNLDYSDSRGVVDGQVTWLSANSFRIDKLRVYDRCPGDGHGMGVQFGLHVGNDPYYAYYSYTKDFINSQGCGTWKTWTNVTVTRSETIWDIQYGLCKYEGTKNLGVCSSSPTWINPFT